VLGFLTGLYPVGFEGRIHYNRRAVEKYEAMEGSFQWLNTEELRGKSAGRIWDKTQMYSSSWMSVPHKTAKNGPIPTVGRYVEQL